VTDERAADLPAGVSLARLLADGCWHPAEVLGARLQSAPVTAVRLAAQLCERLGLTCLQAPDQGVRLTQPLALLDAERIRAMLVAAGRAVPPSLEVHDALDSTNRYLMSEVSGGAPSGTVCLAEYQTAGRGRLGRAWVSPFGANLYLSMLWRTDSGPAALGGCSLVVGAALADTLRRAGVSGLGLKWPNDLLWQRRKLAGVLLEVAGQARGPSVLVAGVGINVNMPVAAGRDIEQPWVDLREALGVAQCDRDWVAAHVIHALAAAFERFECEGLQPFLDLWSEFDLFQGESVRIISAASEVSGTILGIAADGGLRVQTAAGEHRVHGGEVSLRAEGAQPA
jgi:BirA family biotin operon repressor/biotin-[acetyl-CoA-carboxylase] ligase